MRMAAIDAEVDEDSDFGSEIADKRDETTGINPRVSSTTPIARTDRASQGDWTSKSLPSDPLLIDSDSGPGSVGHDSVVLV